MDVHTLVQELHLRELTSRLHSLHCVKVPASVARLRAPPSPAIVVLLFMIVAVHHRGTLQDVVSEIVTSCSNRPCVAAASGAKPWLCGLRCGGDPVDLVFIVGVITSSLDSHIESLRLFNTLSPPLRFRTPDGHQDGF